MNKEQLIATLQACYFGDKGAFNLILKKYQELQQENNQLKEQRQELRSWLEEEIDEYGNSDAWLLEIGVIKNVLSKLNELEGGKNNGL